MKLHDLARQTGEGLLRVHRPSWTKDSYLELQILRGGVIPPTGVMVQLDVRGLEEKSALVIMLFAPAGDDYERV